MHDDAPLLRLIPVPEVDHEDETVTIDGAFDSQIVPGRAMQLSSLYSLGRHGVASFIVNAQPDYGGRRQWSSVLWP